MDALAVSKYFLTTRRLGFRAWSEDDLDLALGLWGDPEVTRLIDARGKLSEGQVRERLAQEITTARSHGVQYWPVFLLENGEHVGCCGLRPYDLARGILELGFHIRSEHWGQGHATEAARAVMAYAFEQLRVSGLFAGHNPKNAASRHLLGKLGFRYTHDELYEPTGLEHPCYLLTAEEYPGLEFLLRVTTANLHLAADAALDLHMHTTYSDGDWAPEALLDHLFGEKFGLAAIADHDRAGTVAAIQQLALEKGLPVLVAVEMSSSWQGELVDLLCYGFDPNGSALHDLSQDVARRQHENTLEVYENLLRRGYLLTPDALAEVLATPSVQQPHALVARLKAQGYGLGEPPAGKILRDAGCAFATNEPAVVVGAAHQSGAVCLLAHPGRGDGFVNFDVESLDRFRQEAPIDGLEVYYPLHTPAQTAMFGEYARRHALLVGAGSDSHGPDKPPVKYRAEMCRDLLERVGVEMV